MKVPESGAKKTMLDAAEVLVAAHGFDAVSVRDITSAAKANIAAVNYHFGSRDNLMALMISHLLEPICAARLSALEALGSSVSPELLIDAYLDFLSALPRTMGMEKQLFYRLAGRILVLPEEAIEPAHEVNRRYVEALQVIFPDKNSDELASAWAFFSNGIAQSLFISASIEELPIWRQFALGGLGVNEVVPVIQTSEEAPVISEKTEPEPEPEPEPEAKPSKGASQPMLFDF